MRSIAVIVLHTLVAQALAKDVATAHSNDLQVSVNTVVNKLLDKLMDRVSSAPIHLADLDETTLEKPSAMTMKPASVPSLACTPPPAVRAVQAQLRTAGIPYSPLETLALTTIGATRDVSLAAQIKPVFNCMDRQSRATVIAMGEAVEEKAAESPAEEESKPEEASEPEAEKKVASKLNVEDMAGVTSFPGFFDPAGYSTDIPAGKLLFYREAELKHGRVGMLASLGFVVQDVFHPFFGGQEGSALSLVPGTNIELQAFWGVALLAMGALEAPRLGMISGGEVTQETLDSGALPGDLGFDPLNLKPKEADKLKDLQTKELNNGRLAMLAAAGMLAQQAVDGKGLFPIHGGLIG